MGAWITDRAAGTRVADSTRCATLAKDVPMDRASDDSRAPVGGTEVVSGSGQWISDAQMRGAARQKSTAFAVCNDNCTTTVRLRAAASREIEGSAGARARRLGVCLSNVSDSKKHCIYLSNITVC